MRLIRAPAKDTARLPEQKAGNMAERWQTYGVRKSEKAVIVDRICRAIRVSGGEVIHASDPGTAPFEIHAKTGSGRRLHLLCYAFLANKYGQQNRPDDEHRFQIKYGRDLSGYHEVFVDPKRKIVTLFLGVHLDEDVFIALDPAMHNPTRFSASSAVKSWQIEEAKRTGWSGFERERSSGRRKRDMPLDNNLTESVLLFNPANFLQYVEFETLATGMDAGERHLLIDRLAAGGSATELQHPLELQFGLSASQILDVIWGAFRLKAAVKGNVAEYYLQQHLESISEIRSVRMLDEDGRPDFEIETAFGPRFVECKNVLRKEAADGPRVDFQKTRAAKGNPCSRYYERNAFDILAACLHPVTERWEFRFRRTAAIPEHPKCAGRLSNRVVVLEDWDSDIRSLVSP